MYIRGTELNVAWKSIALAWAEFARLIVPPRFTAGVGVAGGVVGLGVAVGPAGADVAAGADVGSSSSPPQAVTTITAVRASAINPKRRGRNRIESSS
jgi:hypothetical protein